MAPFVKRGSSVAENPTANLAEADPQGRMAPFVKRGSSVAKNLTANLAEADPQVRDRAIASLAREDGGRFKGAGAGAPFILPSDQGSIPGAPEVRSLVAGRVSTVGRAAQAAADIIAPDEEGVLRRFSREANIFAEKLRPPDGNPAAAMFLEALGSTAPSVAITASGFYTGNPALIVTGLAYTLVIGGLAESAAVAERSKRAGSTDNVVRAKTVATALGVGALDAVGAGGIARSFRGITQPGLRKVVLLVDRLLKPAAFEGLTEGTQVVLADVVMQSYDPDVDFLDRDAVIRWIKDTGKQAGIEAAVGGAVGGFSGAFSLITRSVEEAGGPEALLDDIEAEVDQLIEEELKTEATVAGVLGTENVEDVAQKEPARKEEVEEKAEEEAEKEAFAGPVLEEDLIDEAVLALTTLDEIVGPSEPTTPVAPVTEPTPAEKPKRLNIFQLRKIAKDNGVKHSDIKGPGAVARLEERLAQQGVPTVKRAGLAPIPPPFQNLREIKSRILAITGITKVGRMLVDAEAAFREALRLEARGARVGVKHGRKIEREKQALQRLAQKAKENIEKKIEDIMRRVSSVTDVRYRKQIEAIQDGLTVAKGKELKALKDTAEFVERQLAEGEEVLVPPSKLRQLSKKALADMTVDELTELHAYIELLRKLGRLKFKLKRSRRAQTIDTAVKSLVVALKTKARRIFGGAPLVLPDKGSPRPVSRSESYFLAGERMLRFFDRLDGYDPNGPWKALFWRPIRAADAKFNLGWTAVNVALEKVIQSYGGNQEFYAMLSEETAVGDGPLLTGQERVGIVLIAANPATRAQIIKRGVRRANGNDVGLSEGVIRDVEQSITPAEQRFQDFLTNFFHEQGLRIETVYESVYNAPFPRLGNYFPSMDAEAIADEDNVFGTQVFERAKENVPSSLLPRWFTRERTPGSKEVLRVDAFNVWRIQARQVEFFMAHAGVMGDIVAIAKDPRIGRALRETQGVSRTPLTKDTPGILELDAMKMLKEWVQDVSRSGPKGHDDRVLDILRRNAVVAVLGFKLTTGVRQLGSTLNAMGEYWLMGGNATAILNGWKDTMYNFEEASAWANEHFDFIRFRNIEQVLDEIERVWAKKGLTIDGKPLTLATRKTQKAALAMVRGFDKATIIAVAKGIYDGEIARGQSHEQAIETATQILETTQPASAIRDLPFAFRQGGTLKWMMTFQNMFNQMMGQQLTAIQQLRAGKLPAHDLPLFYLLTVIMHVLLAAFVDRGFRIPDSSRAARSASGFIANTFHGIGPVLNTLLYSVSTGRDASLSLVPLEPFVRAGKAAGALGRGDIERAALELMKAFGAASGLPASALVNFGQGAADIINEVPEAVIGETGLPDPRALVTSRFSRRGAEK